jgi:atypical dual specificity phosphatase
LFERGDIPRWIYGRIFGRPANFSFVDEFVAGSAGPLSLREVDWLREKRDIKAILSVREGPLVKTWVEGVSYLNVPVKNHFPPTLEQLDSCVEFILLQISLERKTAVHCAAGRGRTGTVLAAYLCKRHGLSAEEAINQIRSKRHGSIERSQEGVIGEYYRSLRRSAVNLETTDH